MIKLFLWTIFFICITVVSQKVFGVSCTSKDGRHVTYKPVLADIIYARGFTIAVAGRNPKTDKRVVYYDRAGLSGTPKAFRDFSLYHECGHHALGHIKPGMKIKRAIHTSKEEHEADCYAKKRVEASGGNMEAVYTTLRNSKKMRALGADLNHSYARAHHIKKCN